MGEIVTRLYQEDDDKEIVKLLRSSFSFWAEMQNPLEFWRWKYRQSPLETHVVVSTVGKEIVGVGHCIKMNVKLGNRVLISYYDDDYATNPEYRNKGVYKAITNFIDKIKKDTQADFCYWMTRNPIVLTKAIIHEQVSFPTPFSDLVRINNIDHYIEKYPYINDSQFKTSLSNQPLPYFDKPGQAPKTDYTLIDIESFDEGFEAFWDDIEDDYDYILKRNRNYMNWRFTKNPKTKYKIKAALSGDSVVGYIVLEIEEDYEYLAGSIFDLLSLPNRVDVVFSLFEEAVNYFNKLNVDWINLTTMQGHTNQKIADSLGFVNDPNWKEFRVMFWGYNDYFYDTISSLKPERIYFSYSDYY